MTADMLDNEHDSELASILAQGTIPREVLDGMRLGRLSASRKPDGGREGDRRERCYATFCGEDNGKAGCQGS